MEETPNYYAIIPASVRYDKELPDKAKLLYGEITSLTHKTGECWASNKYFANLYGCTIRTISSLINKLKDKGYIDVNLIRKGKEIEKREIRIKDMVLKNISNPIEKKLDTPMEKNFQENNTSNNNINSQARLVIDYLNEQTGKHFKYTEANLKHIRARFNENFTLDDLKQVVDNQVEDWLNSEKMNKFLRPETLFGNKCDNYLNAKEKANGDSEYNPYL